MAWYEVEVVKAIRFMIQVKAESEPEAEKQALDIAERLYDSDGDLPDFTVEAIDRMTDADVKRMLHFGEGGEAGG